MVEEENLSEPVKFEPRHELLSSLREEHQEGHRTQGGHREGGAQRVEMSFEDSCRPGHKLSRKPR